MSTDAPATKKEIFREIMQGGVWFQRDREGQDIYLCDGSGWMDCDQQAVRELLCDEIPNRRHVFVAGWDEAKPTGKVRWEVE